MTAHGEQASTGLEPIEEIHRQGGHCTGDGHRIEFALRLEIQGIGQFNADVGQTRRTEARLRAFDEIGVDVDAHHITRQLRQTGGEEARAGADFEHFVFGAKIQRLQQPAFHHRLHHALAVFQWQRHIGERHAAVARRHEILAPYRTQHIEHARIQHIPGANLLVHHERAGLFEIERHEKTCMYGQKENR